MDKEILHSSLIADANWRMLGSGSYWVADSFSVTGTNHGISDLTGFRLEPNIRIYTCKHCEASIIVNIDKITSFNLVCPSCGSVTMDRKE